MSLYKSPRPSIDNCTPMKHVLLPIALVTSAASAHAWNLEFQLGSNNPSDSLWDNGTVTGMSVSFNAAPQVCLGLTVSGANFDIDDIDVTEIDTLTATFDLRYDLSNGGIKPYIGASFGNTWADYEGGDTTALTTSVNLGIAYEISSTTSFVIGSRFYRVWDVDVEGLDIGDLEGVEGFVAIRFKI